jgi:hypothetical protein
MPPVFRTQERTRRCDSGSAWRFNQILHTQLHCRRLECRRPTIAPWTGSRRPVHGAPRPPTSKTLGPNPIRCRARRHVRNANLNARPQTLKCTTARSALPRSSALVTSRDTPPCIKGRHHPYPLRPSGHAHRTRVFFLMYMCMRVRVSKISGMSFGHKKCNGKYITEKQKQ